jgi:hypothetical protein
MAPNARFMVLVAAWGAAASVAGAPHALARVPPQAVPFAIAGATAAFTVGILGTGWLNAGMRSLGLRGILAVHLTRFIGLYFLWLHAQGRLPREFAERAGWGDVVAASGAAILLLLPRVRGFREAVLAWNVVGLADLVLAVATATWLNITRPGSMAEIATLPLALIPLWLVPMLVASHVFLMRAKAGGEGAWLNARTESRECQTSPSLDSRDRSKAGNSG